MTDLSRHRTLSQPAASTQEDINQINDALDRRFLRERAIGSNSIFNGSTKFVNAMLTLIVTLMTAGICGGVVAYAQLQAIATEQKNQKELINYIIAGKLK